MEKKITYREFQKQDTTYVADIIKEVWNYDRLTTPKTAKKLSMLYLYSYLSNQTYTQVALENDIPIGIIMEKNAASHKCPFRYRLKQIGALVSIYLSKEGRKVMKTFESVNHIDKDLIKETGCTYEGEKRAHSILTENRQRCPSSYMIHRLHNPTESFYFLPHFRYTVSNRSYQSRRILMELLFHDQEECHRIEVYNEYLKKIPELLKQLETVETMYQIENESSVLKHICGVTSHK